MNGMKRFGCFGVLVMVAAANRAGVEVDNPRAHAPGRPSSETATGVRLFWD